MIGGTVSVEVRCSLFNALGEDLRLLAVFLPECFGDLFACGGELDHTDGPVADFGDRIAGEDRDVCSCNIVCRAVLHNLVN